MTSASPTIPRRSVKQTFTDLRAKNQIAMMPFIAAGYPDLESTLVTLPALEQAGANLIEIGFPFSDPIADGPVIAEAFVKTLARKIRVADVFATIAKVRPRMSIPLIAMISYTIVYRYGLDRFVAEAKQAGFDGLILPDLPPPEAEKVCTAVQSGGLDTILLIAPTTTEARRKEIARLSSGFIYYLSISGITGERTSLPADLEANLKQLKSLTDRPICVGFGINKPEHVKQLAGLADGAIVGSGVVRRMTEAAPQGPTAVAKSAGDYCREMLAFVR